MYSSFFTELTYLEVVYNVYVQSTVCSLHFFPCHTLIDYGNVTLATNDNTECYKTKKGY